MRAVRFARPVVAVSAVAGLLLSASPASAQSLDDLVQLPVEIPGLEDGVDAIEDLLDIGGLELLDPVLETVTGVVTDVVERVDQVLVDTPLPNTLALQGQDAIDAAVAFSQATFDESETVLLARDDLFADALTTGALQGLVDAPLLLTASGDLDRRVAAEIIRLDASRVLVVGGDAAVSPLVLQKLEIAGFDVTQVGGASRIETAALAAAATAPDATTVVLTRAYSASADDSQAYADLLAVSPWAAQQGWPVLLTQTDVLTPSVRAHLAESAATDVVIVGGTQAVSQAVQDELTGMGLDVRRVAGASRFATAVAIAGERGFDHAGDADRLVLTEGTAINDMVWAPGFASAAYASGGNAPVLLTAGPTLPQETMAFITAGVGDNLADGGPATLCATFVDPIACEAAGLLLLGHVTDVIDLLDLELIDIPFIEQVLIDLGLTDLLDLLDAVDGVVDGIISGIADGDLQAVVDALTGAIADVEGIVEGLIGSDIDVTDPIGTVDDIVDVIDGVVDDVLPGTGSDDDGGLLDPITDPLDPITDPLDPITDPLDPITDPLDPITDPILGGGDDGGILDPVLGGDGGGLLDSVTDGVGGLLGV